MQPAPDTPFSHIDRIAALLIGVTPAMIFLGRAPLAVTAILALIAVLALPDRQETLRRSRGAIFCGTGLAILILFLLWLPNIGVSPTPGRSASVVLRCAAFVAATVPIWAYLLGNRQRVDLACAALVVGSLVLAAISIAAILWWPQLFSITHLKDEVPLYPAVAYKQTGSAAVLILPLVAMSIMRLYGPLRVLSLLAVIALIAVVVLTGNRAGMIGLMSATLAVGLMILVVGRRVVAGVSVVIVVVALLSAAASWNAFIQSRPPPEGAVVFLPTTLVDWHRQTIWHATWEKSSDHRWFGVGVNAINMLPGAKDEIGTTHAMVLAFHPHNWTLEIAAETGLISLVWMLGLLAWISARLWFSPIGGLTTESMCSMAIWAGYWVSGLFNFSYWSSWWQVSFYFCLAVALAASATAGKRTAQADPF